MFGKAESAADMEALGRLAAEHAVPGCVFALTGDLGAGKTHWTKGFVAGMGAREDVTSPTFSLVHEYRSGSLPVFHLDFYRLSSGEELTELGWDEFLEENGVVIAEWADKFPQWIPERAIWMKFVVTPDGCREIIVD